MIFGNSLVLSGSGLDFFIPHKSHRRLRMGRLYSLPMSFMSIAVLCIQLTITDYKAQHGNLAMMAAPLRYRLCNLVVS